MKDYRYIGKSLSNDSAYEKVTGRTVYCSDMESTQMLHIKCKPSEVAHGIIKKIDTSRAEALEGVRAVYTYLNTPDTYYDRGRVSAYEAPYSANQERLFDAHVRFYGERVAAVVAETPEIAQRGCDLIDVEYEVLPAAITMEDALAEGAPLVHEEGNAYPTEMGWGDYERAKGDRIFTSQVETGRMTHMCMETQCARARYECGKLTIWVGTQTVYGVRSTVADFLGMPYSKVRVVKTVMGGSFGAKQEMMVEPLTAFAARDLEADVKLVYTREEQIVNTMLKHNLISKVESKVDADGTIQGIRVHTDMEAGAYLTITPSYLRTMGGKLGKVYDFHNIRFTGRTVCTHTPVNGSFRSWGSSEATVTVETHLNKVARELGMDPIEFRLKNVLKPGSRDVMHGATIGEIHFAEALEKGRDRFQWEKRKEECRRKNEEKGRYRYGVGMAMASHTTSFYPYLTEIATASMRIQDDGSLVVRVPVHDHGCGTVMAMKKMAGEIFEIGLDKIELLEADTQNSEYDYGCYGSRTLYVFGKAIIKCAEELLEKARKMAARKLGCMPNTVWYEEGEFFREPANKKSRLNLRTLKILYRLKNGYQNKTTTPVLV